MRNKRSEVVANVECLEELMEDLLEIEREASIDRGLSEEENELRIEALSDHNHRVFPKLVTCALQASEDGMALPATLSDWMLGYIIDHVSGKEEPFVIEDMKTPSKAEVGISRHKCYIILSQIKIAFEKRKQNKVDVMVKKIKSDLVNFQSKQVKYHLTASQYGYLLANKKEKLTMGDMQEYFEAALPASKSKVKRIFIAYNLNDEIKKLIG